MSISSTSPAPVSLPAFISGSYRALRLAHLRARIRRQTIAELSKLSQRALDDIGVTPGMITRLGNEAAAAAQLN